MHEESSSLSTEGEATVSPIPDDQIATKPPRSMPASKPNRGKRTPPMPATLATTKAKLERSVERVEAALTGLMEAADKLSKGAPEPMRDVAKLQRQYTTHYRDGTLLASHRDGLRQRERRVEGYKVMDYVIADAGADGLNMAEAKQAMRDGRSAHEVLDALQGRH